MEYEIFEVLEPHVDLDGITNQTHIFNAVRYHIMYGGRGGGKSVFVAKTLVLEAYFSDIQVLCARELQNSISDSVMALLWEQVEALGLERFFVKTKTEICGINGSRFFFRGLTSNITSVKSIARIDRVWVEEAEAVSEDSWKTLTPSIRTTGARVIITFNPKSLLDPTYQRFVINPPSDSIVTKINWRDNPHFPQSLEQERQDMLLKDPDGYLHVWEGEPLADSEMAIIPPKWARACVDVHKLIGLEKTGVKRIGFDVSGGGKDPNANVIIDGQIVTFAKEFRQTDPVSAAMDSWQNMLDQGATSFTFDVIGVGSGTAQTLKEPAFEYLKLGKGAITITPFDAGGEVEDKDMNCPMHSKPNRLVYHNLKAQMWWRLRYSCQQAWLATQGMDYDRDAVLSIDSESLPKDTLEKLLFEMSAPQREYLGSKLRVEPKDKLAKRGIPSHNLADALIMARYEKRAPSLASALAARRKLRG